MTIKTVANESSNPYAHYPLVNEREVFHSGHKYALKTHCKTYGKMTRVAKCALALLLTVLTAGLLLIKQSFRGEWGKVVHGSASKLVRIPKAELEITQDILERGKQFVLNNSQLIDNRQSDGTLSFYNGKHCVVFTHTAFPGLIFKRMTKDQAEDSLKSLEKARTLVDQHHLDTCYIPKAKVIELDARQSLFVMEKAPGNTNSEACKMESECEYELFSSNSQIKEKWRTYFAHAAELIARLGYWDTDWRNILLDKDNGFSFIDFERNEPTADNIKNGIERLLKMAPPEFYGEIASIAKRHGVNIDISTLQQEQKVLLETNAGVRKWHRQNSVTDQSPVLNEQGYNSTTEKAIIDKLTAQLNDACHKDRAGENLVERRKAFWQPLCDLSVSRSDFDAALTQLKNKNILCSWTVEENRFQAQLACYNIYF